MDISGLSSSSLGSEQVFTAQYDTDMNTLEGFSNMDFDNLTEEDIHDVAEQFESLFLTELFKSMRSTVPENDWLDSGMQNEVFEDMLYEEYALDAAESGGIGLADMIYDSLVSSYDAMSVSEALSVSAEIDQEV